MSNLQLSTKSPFTFAVNQHTNSFENSRHHHTSLDFLTLPLKFFYALCLSPFYLKLISTPTDNGIFRSEFVAKSWLPQKFICAILTILNLFWILRFLRESLPPAANNPSHHIEMLIIIVSSLYKCIMLKKLWTNQADFVNIGNFVLKSDLPILHKKWLGTKINIIILSLMLMYTVLGVGYVNWRTNLLNWWNANVGDGRKTFLFESSVKLSDQDSLGNIALGICSIVGLLHRSALI